MTAFTDDDLKRLKGNLESWGKSEPKWCSEIKALLARLEAAERMLDLYPHHRWSQQEADAYVAWLRAAGKGR